MPDQRHLIVKLKILGREPIRQRLQARGVRIVRGQRLGYLLKQCQAVQQRDQLAQQRFEIRCQRGHALDLCQDTRPVSRGQRIEQVQGQIARQGPEHGAHARLLDPPAAEGDRLIEQTQAVAHAPVGPAGQQGQRGGLKHETFGLQDMLKPGTDLLGQEASQIQLQTAREHRDRDLLRVGGREQELHMRRRLLQGLQQGVEAVVGEHVHLVDQIDLVACTGRGIGDVVQKLAGLIDLGARGGIHLDEIHESTAVDLSTGRADTAGTRAHALLAVQRLGEDTGKRGLADTAGAGKEVGMMELVAIERVGECADHMRLSDQIIEALGAPFAGEHLVGHA